MPYADYLYVPDEEDNPNSWFHKAGIYHSATSVLIEKFVEGGDGDSLFEISTDQNAINAAPYLASLSLELYMKGFLISFGWSKGKATSMRHDLAKLRSECQSYNENWGDQSIVFVCDRLGQFILGTRENFGGGIRYPRVRDMAVYTSEFLNALKLAYLIVKDNADGALLAE